MLEKGFLLENFLFNDPFLRVFTTTACDADEVNTNTQGKKKIKFSASLLLPYILQRTLD